MPIMNKRDTYGSVAIALHWLLFLLIVGLVASGKYSDSLPRGEKIDILINNHKQVGVAVFLLMSFRLLWKLINSSVESMSESIIARFLAFLVHWSLYLVILAQALVGITMMQYASREVFLFSFELPILFGDAGIFSTPTQILSDNARDAAKQLRGWHHYGGNIIIGLVGLHFFAAIANLFLGGESLKRMWFGYKPPYAK